MTLNIMSGVLELEGNDDKQSETTPAKGRSISHPSAELVPEISARRALRHPH